MIILFIINQLVFIYQELFPIEGIFSSLFIYFSGVGSILISWEASNNDYLFSYGNQKKKYEDVNPTGTHSDFYAHQSFSYDRHYILSSQRDDLDASEMKQSFKDLVKHLQKQGKPQVIPKYMGIEDVLSVAEITERIKPFLLQVHDLFPKDEIELFISPGTPSMQLAWYLASLSMPKSMIVKLFQIRAPKFRKPNHSIKEYIVVQQSAYTSHLIALESSRIRRVRQQLDKRIFKTKALEDEYSKAELLAATDNVTVFISGGSGTGKEYLAQYIHDCSARSKEQYRAINCGAFQTSELMESRLFGYSRGAFTGAEKDTKGEFHFANKGTLFLDEVADMSLSMQQLLLRVLQNKEIYRVGAQKSEAIDIRVVCATHKDLPDLVNKGKFRLDLYYRLMVAQLKLPSFSSYTEQEKTAVFDYFLEKWCNTLDKPKLKLSSVTKKILLEHAFPGNMRELDNLFHNFYIFCNQGVVNPNQIPEHILNHDIQSEPVTLKEVERQHISKMRFLHPKIATLARVLGKDEKTIRKKLKEYGIE